MGIPSTDSRSQSCWSIHFRATGGAEDAQTSKKKPEGADPAVIGYVAAQIERTEGMHTSRSLALGGHGVLMVTADRWLIEAEAERLCLKVRLKGAILPEDFCRDTRDLQPISPAEECCVLGELLDRVPAGEGLADVLGRKGGRGGLVAPDALLLVLLQERHVIESWEPLHNEGQKREAWRTYMRHCLLSDKGVNALRDYYGERVALVFAWSEHFLLWLVPLGVVALVHWLLSDPSVTVEDSPILPIYAMAWVVWGGLLYKFWIRRVHTLSAVWGADADAAHAIVQPHFHGQLRISPITSKPELYYPAWRRRCHYAVSMVVTTAMLGFAFIVMVGSLNLQGYIDLRSPSPLRIDALAAMAEPGAWFDPVGRLSLVPVLLHVAVVAVLNQRYRHVAVWLTRMENHRTFQQHENALVAKRVVFEMIDCYMSLIYLAAWELDATKVRSELVALYTTDCVRRLATEVALPFASLWFHSRFGKDRDDYAAAKKRDVPEEVVRARRELDKPELELFDDLLELALQHGYTFLFASVFPGAALLSCLYALVEIRGDAFKLAFIHRRPRPVRDHSLGAWRAVLLSQTLLACFTNVFLVALSSEQLLQWLPYLYESGDPARSMFGTPALGKGRWVVGVMMAMEHALVAALLAILFGISDVPKGIREALERQEYQREQLARNARQAASFRQSTRSSY